MRKKDKLKKVIETQRVELKQLREQVDLLTVLLMDVPHKERHQINIYIKRG